MVSIMGDIAVDQAKGALNIVLATAVDEIKSTCGFKGDLNKLKKRSKTLQEIPVGTGTDQSPNNLQRDWVELVKKVAHHADDLVRRNFLRESSKEVGDQGPVLLIGEPAQGSLSVFLPLVEPTWFPVADGSSKAHDPGIKPTKLVAATGIDGGLGSGPLGGCIGARRWWISAKLLGGRTTKSIWWSNCMRSDKTGDLSFVAIVGIAGSLLSSTLSHFIA
ncbi:hypothetical protein Dimus_006293 [Dionaea muscipula]